MDYITDRSNRHLLHINNLIQAPAYVKQASVDADEAAKLPAHVFADTARREFPLDSAGHTYLSYAYCKSAGVTDAAILAKIKSATARFPELAADLDEFDRAFAASVKRAGSEPRHAIYVDFGTAKSASTNPMEKLGGVHGFYPINNPVEISDAATKMANESHKLPLSLFVQGCKALVKAASEHPLNSRLPAMVERYGVERLPDLEFVKQQAVHRQRLTGDNVYLEIAESIGQDPDRAQADWAELWIDADAHNGVKYAKSALDPYVILNSGIAKAAFDREVNKWTLVHGATVPVDALTAISEDSLTANFPAKEAAAVRATLAKSASLSGPDLAAELQALPAPVQQTLLKLVLR